MPDAVVIGGGAVGLATARELRRRRLSVTVLERDRPGRAASWASAGIVSAPAGPSVEPGVQLQALSYRLWPAFAKQVQDESGLDPEFRLTGCLVPALDAAQANALRRTSSSGHVEGGRLLENAALHEAEPSLSPAIPAALWRPGGNVENRRLCRALEIACRRSGVEVRSGAEVREIILEGNRVGGVRLVDAAIPARHVVVAAGAWSSGIAGCRPIAPVTPQRGQILALERGDVDLRHVILTPGDPYIVPRADGRVIVGATREMAGWSASLTAGGVAWLLNTAIRIVPDLAHCAINELWTGFRPLSSDGVPIIGRGDLDGLFFATGHGPSGIGPLPGTVALLAALMFGEAAPISPQPFSPLRFLH